jgi:hypothetical protein
MRLKPEFIEWLNEYKLTTFEYKEYLTNYFGMDLQSKELAELGKGNIDSVVDGDALLITPYGHTFSDLSHTNSTLDFNGSVLMLNVYGEQS